MGKRSITSTKSGKFMNPTDQARKEARRKELKKNKKQRLAVRTAVIKGKNPREIVAELEKIDDMEYNPITPPLLNDKVLKEKRRKLLETWARVMKIYEKDNVEGYMDLKKLWHSYQNRKVEVIKHFESVKCAQNVAVEEIPLPAGDDGPQPFNPSAIPLPPSITKAIQEHQQAKAGILKKPSSVLDLHKPMTCPGVPAGPPPLLSDYDDEEGAEERTRKIRFDVTEEKEQTAVEGPQVGDIQKKMLQMSGQDVDQYMKEMEEVHKSQAENEQPIQSIQEPAQVVQQQMRLGLPPGAPPGAPPAHLMMAARPPLMFRPAPPPLRPGMAPSSVRLPPGPPPGKPQGSGLPPGPPSGIPSVLSAGSSLGGGVLSAGPQITENSRPDEAHYQPEPAKPSHAPGQSVIQAKPQMRNLKSGITRFVPTNVKIRRDAPSKRKAQDPIGGEVFKPPGHLHQVPQQQQQAQSGSKDDAYAQFMMEMNQLMK